jgi:hypothetical protein
MKFKVIHTYEDALNGEPPKLLSFKLRAIHESELCDKTTRTLKDIFFTHAPITQDELLRRMHSEGIINADHTLINHDDIRGNITSKHILRGLYDALQLERCVPSLPMTTIAKVFSATFKINIPHRALQTPKKNNPHEQFFRDMIKGRLRKLSET